MQLTTSTESVVNEKYVKTGAKYNNCQYCGASLALHYQLIQFTKGYRLNWILCTNEAAET